MSTENITNRRDLVKIALAIGATAAAGALLPKEASAEQSWADKFVWVSPGGIPERGYTPEAPVGAFDVILNRGQTGIGVFSQLSYEKNDPVTGAPLDIKGRENHPVVVVVTGDPNQDQTRLRFTNMPVRGGWFGIVANPGGTATLTDAQIYEAVSARINALRKPELNNCQVGVGCQGVIEYISIDGSGEITDHGSRRN